MSTPSERLEASIWLESTLPDAPPELREKFFADVDEYYARHPTADRGPDVLASLKADNEAFVLILRAVLPGDCLPVDFVETTQGAPVSYMLRIMTL